MIATWASWFDSPTTSRASGFPARWARISVMSSWDSRMSSRPSRRSSRFVRWVRSASKFSSVRTGPRRVCRGSVRVGSFVVGSGGRLGWGVVRVGEVSGFGVVGLDVARLWILAEELPGLGDTGLGVARLWTVVEVPEVEIRVSGVGVVRSGWVGVRLGWGVVVVLVAVLFVR